MVRAHSLVSKRARECATRIISKMKLKQWYFLDDLASQANLNTIQMGQFLREQKFFGRTENRSRYNARARRGRPQWRRLR